MYINDYGISFHITQNPLNYFGRNLTAPRVILKSVSFEEFKNVIKTIDFNDYWFEVRCHGSPLIEGRVSSYSNKIELLSAVVHPTIAIVSPTKSYNCSSTKEDVVRVIIYAIKTTLAIYKDFHDISLEPTSEKLNEGS